MTKQDHGREISLTNVGRLSQEIDDPGTRSILDHETVGLDLPDVGKGPSKLESRLFGDQ